MTTVFHSTSVGIVYLEPIYDSKNKTYNKILTLGDMPSMPFAQYVRKINTPVLSSLYQIGNKSRCIYAILKSLDSPEYMQAEDIPRLFEYLISSGYTVDSDFTKILQNSNIAFTGGSSSGSSDRGSSRTLVFVFKTAL